MSEPTITPRLVVDDAQAALDFYTAALGGTERHRFTEPSGRVVHAEVEVGRSRFSVTQTDGHHNVSPTALGGSGLLLTLTVPDADAVGAAMVAGGAEVVIPIDDQFYGAREGRLRDPFGHLWIVSQGAPDLPDDEIQRRLDDAGH